MNTFTARAAPHKKLITTVTKVKSPLNKMWSCCRSVCTVEQPRIVDKTVVPTVRLPLTGVLPTGPLTLISAPPPIRAPGRAPLPKKTEPVVDRKELSEKIKRMYHVDSLEKLELDSDKKKLEFDNIPVTPSSAFDELAHYNFSLCERIAWFMILFLAILCFCIVAFSSMQNVIAEECPAIDLWYNSLPTVDIYTHTSVFREFLLD